MAKKTSAAMTRKSPDSVQIEDAEYCIGKALGVALLLNERTSGDKHDAAAAGAIVDELQAALRALSGEEARHG